MSEPTLPTVALDQAEAVELAEVCELVARWLTGAGPAVDASLDAFVGIPGWRFELRDTLVAWAQLLVTRGPRP